MHTAGSPAAQFRAAQDAVLAETGVATKVSFIDVGAPPLQVQLLEAGSGAPVVMIHGGNGFAASWAPLLPRLSESFRLLMPDRPGCGLTTMFDYRGVDLRRHGTEFLGGVLDSLRLERVALIGNSMGGFFAMAFAIDHPERVSALVLTGEPAGADGNPRLYHRLVGTRGINAFLYATALSPAKDAAGARAGLMKAISLLSPAGSRRRSASASPPVPGCPVRPGVGGLWWNELSCPPAWAYSPGAPPRPMHCCRS